MTDDPFEAKDVRVFLGIIGYVLLAYAALQFLGVIPT